jgi:hypothetical protein
MKQLSVGEQRYKAVLALISEGQAVMEVASRWSISAEEPLWGLPDPSGHAFCFMADY